MASKLNLLAQLNEFLKKLDSYSAFRYTQTKRITFTNKEVREASELRDSLLEEIGPISRYIDELGCTNVIKVKRDGETYTLTWGDEALKMIAYKYTLSELAIGIDTIKKAIGQLKYDIEHGVRNDNGDIIKPLLANNQPAKAFISHGKQSNALNKIERFLRELGIEPLIVKDQASQDKTVDDKVNYYLDQSDCVVILATGDVSIDTKLHPRENVIHEIGLAQKTLAGKIIYLLEKGAEFPSNISPKVWETFKQSNMENVFQRIIIELRAFGILQTKKPNK